MNRRAFLRAAGVGGVGATIAGCSTGNGGDDDGNETNDTDTGDTNETDSNATGDEASGDDGTDGEDDANDTGPNGTGSNGTDDNATDGANGTDGNGDDGHDLVVTVEDEAGEPVDDAIVRIRTEGDILGGLFGGEETEEAATDSDGEVVAEGLSDGTYTVAAESGDLSGEREVEIDGDSAEVTVAVVEQTEGRLRIATYSSMVDGEEPAGVWLKEAFEERYPDVTIEWTVPEAGVNHYIQRAQQDAGIDVDVYFGLNVDDLVRIDDTLDEQLFASLERDRVERADRVRDDPAVEFGDPDDRVLPYDTGYISLVYDEGEVEGPESFEDLVDPAYEGTLLAQNAQDSDPGRAFLLWTIDAYGADGYLDYWRELVDNDVRILGSWDDAYSAYENAERPMVVSYSTDQVYTNRYDGDMSRSQIAFLEDQGYANPEGMAVFEGSENADLAYAFMDFVLSSEAQAEIAVRNVQFPAVADEHVDLDAEYDEYAHEPPESIALGYEELSGNLGGWIEDWAREIASQ